MSRASSKIRQCVLALAAVAMTAGAVASPALADDWGRRDRVEHRWRDRDDYRPAIYPRYVWGYPPGYVRGYAPGYVPGYVVAPPAPYAVVTPPPSLNLVIPLNFH